MAKTTIKDVLPPSTPPQQKTALDLLREEKEKYLAKIQQQKDQLKNEFLKLLNDINDLYNALISECDYKEGEIYNWPEVQTFLNNFEQEVQPKKESGQRIKSDILNESIINAIKDKPLTHAQLQQDSTIKNLYENIGKHVPSLQMQLKKLLEIKAITSSGEGKSRVYSTI